MNLPNKLPNEACGRDLIVHVRLFDEVQDLFHVVLLVVFRPGGWKVHAIIPYVKREAGLLMR